MKDNNTLQLTFSQWAIVFSVTAALCLVYLDMSGMAVALPSIQSAYEATRSQTQWLMNGYLLAGAMLVFISGKLGDRFSHGRVFQLGVGLFLIASLLCTVAPGIGLFIGFRVLQGIGAALITVPGMSLVTQTVPDSMRGRVLGLSASIGLVIMASGPFLGGVIVHFLNWQWLFYLNVILGSIILIFTRLFSPIPKSLHCDKQPIDHVGCVLSGLFILTLTFSFKNINYFGWMSFNFFSLLFISLVLLISFFIQQKRSTHPLVSPQLFLKPQILLPCVIAGLMQLPLYFMVFLGVFLQHSLGYSPLMAGILLLPMLVLGAVCSNLGGNLVDKFGVRLPVIIGTVCVFLGYSITALFINYHSYFSLLPLLIFSGLGMFIIHNPLRNALLNQVDKSQHGMTNGLFSAVRQMVGVVGFAIIASIISSTETSFGYHAGFFYALCFVAVLSAVSFLLSWWVS